MPKRISNMARRKKRLETPVLRHFFFFNLHQGVSGSVFVDSLTIRGLMSNWSLL